MNMAGVDNIIGFTTYTYDIVLDMYFAQARMYNADNRRFMSVDPVKDSANWYAYCNGNPITFVDPSGTSPKDTLYGFVTALDDNIFLGVAQKTVEFFMGKMDTQFESEYDYYLGRVAGDLAGMAFGFGTCLVGIVQIGKSIIDGATVTILSGGTLIIGGVTIVAAEAAAGAANVATGVGISLMSASNFGNDSSNLERADRRIKESKQDLKKLDEKFLKDNGIDPHEFKTDLLKDLNVKDKVMSHYNIFQNSVTKELFLVPNANIPAIPTGVYIK